MIPLLVYRFEFVVFFIFLYDIDITKCNIFI